MSITVQVTFDERKMESQIANFGKLATQLQAAIVHSMESSAIDVQTEAKRRAPKKTGTLSRSITHEPPKKRGTAIYVRVGTNIEYAAIHEYGGWTGRNHAVHIKEKRYFRGAIEMVRPKISTKFRKIIAMRGLK